MGLGHRALRPWWVELPGPPEPGRYFLRLFEREKSNPQNVGFVGFRDGQLGKIQGFRVLDVSHYMPMSL